MFGFGLRVSGLGFGTLNFKAWSPGFRGARFRVVESSLRMLPRTYCLGFWLHRIVGYDSGDKGFVLKVRSCRLRGQGLEPRPTAEVHQPGGSVYTSAALLFDIAETLFCQASEALGLWATALLPCTSCEGSPTALEEAIAFMQGANFRPGTLPPGCQHNLASPGHARAVSRFSR